MSLNTTSDRHNQTNYTGDVSLTAESCRELIHSFQFYQTARKTNVYISLVIILVGIVGNSLGVLVFAQKRFRIHPSTIYFLFICLSDGLFLLLHYFDDIIRTYIDIYKHEDDLKVFSSIHSIPLECWSLVDSALANQFASPDNIKLHQVLIGIFEQINITDSFNLCCQVVNYLRYFLRFLSAYLIVAFTVQRMFAIRFPFQAQNFESNRLAWRIVVLLAILGSLLNIWVPFWFHIRSEGYCDVSRNFSKAYFYVTCLYILLTMLIPILVIFICNMIILCQIVDSNHRRDMAGVQNILIAATPHNKQTGSESHDVGASVPLNKQTSKRARSSSFRGTLIKHWSNENFKITRMLMFMSLSYAIFNLPYFIAWSSFFYQIGIKKTRMSHSMRYEMYAVMQICEIFYVMNYACHFFIYSASGKRFRQQLKQAFGKRTTGL